VAATASASKVVVAFAVLRPPLEATAYRVPYFCAISFDILHSPSYQQVAQELRQAQFMFSCSTVDCHKGSQLMLQETASCML